MTVRRIQTAMTLPKGKRAPELKKRQLGTAQRPPTSGSACRNRNLRVQRQQISEGAAFLMPISALHSHKKADGSYEKIRA